MNIEDCIKEGFLQKVEPKKDVIKKEFKEADYDLEKAVVALEEKDFKWSIIKSYYSMFHSARALLFSLGLKERRHFVIRIVLEDLYKKGKLEGKYVSDFNAALSGREDADYRYTYSEETAIYLIEAARNFLNKMKQMVK
ncbi:MAG: HEPN domain-containing protein [Candidatus Aenigmarchaeota archaeon]|nr:HEPN domain-containing protein [Candidatus Aenigmarchaeota archaeon]